MRNKHIYQFNNTKGWRGDNGTSCDLTWAGSLPKEAGVSMFYGGVIREVCVGSCHLRIVYSGCNS